LSLLNIQPVGWKLVTASGSGLPSLGKAQAINLPQNIA